MPRPALPQEVIKGVIVMKTKLSRGEIIARLKLAETEEGRTGLVAAFLAKEGAEKPRKSNKEG